jgi:virulence factor Mce-like protein
MSRSEFRKGAVGKPRTRAFLLGVSLAGLLAAVISAYVGYNAANEVPLRSYYNLKAEFTHAENLANHYEVRLGGLRAGQMLKPRVHEGKALIDLKLSSKFKPLLSDTRLRVRLRSAVGVRYVEILPGTKGAPLPEGATIPTSNTARPVALDQVLGTFDPYTRNRAQELLSQLGGGAAGRGADVNQALQLGPEFLSGLRNVSDAITDRPGAMNRFIRSGQAATTTFEPVRSDIAEGFQPEAQAAKVFADRENEIGSTLKEAPSTLRQLSSGLPSVTRLVAEVDGLAREGRPALHAAPGALRETSRLLVNARPALDDADRTLELARRSVNPVLDVLRKLSPVLPGLDTAFDALLPSLKTVGAQACDITNAMTGWGQMMVWGDEHGGGIRFFVHPNSGTIAGDTPTGRLPDGQGGDVLDQFMHKSPYPGPCVNGAGAEAGPERATLAQYLKSLGYTGSTR